MSRSKIEGIYMPLELLRSPETSWAEKAVLLLIGALEDAQGCQATNEQLSELLGASVQTVSNSISHLRSLRLIRQLSSHGHIRTLRTCEGYKKFYSSSPKTSIKKSLFLRRDDNKRLLDNNPPRGSSLVEFWNTLPNVRQHKNPPTKVYQRAVKYIRALRQGRTSKLFALDATKLKRAKIPAAMLTREWTERELKDAMTKLSFAFAEGYWPSDKATIPKDLPSLIYNPHTQYSWLLWAAANGVPRLEHKGRSDGGLYDKLSKVLEDAVLAARGERSLKSGERFTLQTVVKKIAEWEGRHMWASLEAAVKDYASWILSKHEGNEKLSVHKLIPGNSEWKRFEGGL